MSTTPNDYTLIKHKFDKSITVIPIADVHLGALEHNKDAWESFCKYVQHDDDIYLTLGGDLINNSTRSSVANPFDEVIRPRDQKKLMVDYLTPIKDRILCAVTGNHEARSIKDDDIDLTYDILAKLDLEELYRPTVAYMKVSVGKRHDSGGASCAYTFAVTHGSGGGFLTGASVNRNERFGNIIEGLDCLIVGHSHAPAVTKPQKIVIDSRNDTVSLKPYTVVSCESWLTYAGYASSKMLLPREDSNPQKLILSANKYKKSIEVRW